MDTKKKSSISNRNYRSRWILFSRIIRKRIYGSWCKTPCFFNTQRIDHIHQDQHEVHVNFKLYGDLTDSTNIRIIQEVQPDEIYRCDVSCKSFFDSPEYVANVDGLGNLRT
jgi:GDP-D-mannose dehydratase